MTGPASGSAPPSGIVRATRVWALVGVVLLLGRSALVLALRGFEGLDEAVLGAVEWLGLFAIVGLFVWGEGVRALARRWCPRVLARAADLGAHTPWFWRIVAPLRVVGLVGVPRGIWVRSWTAVAAIVVAALSVRQLPDPWRSMVELGVGLALAVGVVRLGVGLPAVVSPDGRRSPSRTLDNRGAE
ncbi:hypothetical protein [Gaopeijia maritima]|uniref:Uncharacterized protein n=1 Tax=Gaopeijia maritima TaxID=3119007 RepID=A0ABU9E4B7_9BACT